MMTILLLVHHYRFNYITLNIKQFNEYQSFNDRKALHLDGSSAFLHLRTFEAQNIGAANTESTMKEKKPLIYKDF